MCAKIKSLAHFIFPSFGQRSNTGVLGKHMGQDARVAALASGFQLPVDMLGSQGLANPSN